MGRVLLISLNRCTTPDPVFPLGLAHLSAALRQAGHEVSWLDALAGLEGLAEVLNTWRPDFIGLSLRNIDDVLIRKRETYHGDLVALVATLRRQTGCPIILGGSGFSIFPQQLLALSGADCGICGEGEAGLVALLAALKSGGDLARVPGLVFQQGGTMRVNPVSSAAFQTELSETDWPAPITARYLETSGMLNVQTQRGCAYRCGYCTYPLIEGSRHRRRPPQLVASEFEQLQRLGARYVFIVDSVFNSSARHVTEVCEALLRRNVKTGLGLFPAPAGSDAGADEADGAGRVGAHRVRFRQLLRRGAGGLPEGFHVRRHPAVQRAGAAGEGRFLPLPDLRRPRRDRRDARDRVSELATAERRRHHGAWWACESIRAPRSSSGRSPKGSISRDTDLLAPAYYLAPGLTAEAVFAQLQEFAPPLPQLDCGRSHRRPTPAWSSACARRGVVGPLWAISPCCSASSRATIAAARS